MEDKISESVLAAAIAKLEAEKQSRVEEKIAKGEAVRVAPVIVGGLYRGDIERERARRTAELRAAGETREIIFGLGPNDPEVIATGVPRGARDEEYVAAFRTRNTATGAV